MSRMFSTRVWLASAIVLLALAAAGYYVLGAVSGPMPIINTLDAGNVAIKGFDPVAYFVEGQPRKGSAAHSLSHKGAIWYFASAENKAKFAASPETYEPAYGGYCAFGVSQGYLVKIEGEAWSIRGGKLYLNYDLDVRSEWLENPDTYIATANRNWPGLIAN